MIGDIAVETETTKPAICQIEMDFLVQDAAARSGCQQ